MLGTNVIMYGIVLVNILTTYLTALGKPITKIFDGSLSSDLIVTSAASPLKLLIPRRLAMVSLTSTNVSPLS